MRFNTSLNSHNKSLRWRISPKRLPWKDSLVQKKRGIESGKVILLSFDKTMELLKCMREMKGKSEIGSFFCSFKHTGKKV